MALQCSPRDGFRPALPVNGGRCRNSLCPVLWHGLSIRLRSPDLSDTRPSAGMRRAASACSRTPAGRPAVRLYGDCGLFGFCLWRTLGRAGCRGGHGKDQKRNDNVLFHIRSVLSVIHRCTLCLLRGPAIRLRLLPVAVRWLYV